MTDIRFYHLTTQNLDDALPAILAKGFSAGKRSLVQFGHAQDVSKFDDLLWTYKGASFLPHGTDKDEHKDKHPILLSTISKNLNKADMLVLCNVQTVPENIIDFTMICDFLDGRDDDSITHGRARYKTYKDLGHVTTYWQQTDTGGWEQKS